MDVLKPLNRLPKSVLEKGILGFEMARSLTFLSQNLLLLALNEKARAQKPEFGPQIRQILKDLTTLLKKDAENIVKGVYPPEVLKTESFKDFFFRTPQILFDSFSVTKRRIEHQSKDFSSEAAEYLRDVPDYFQRNYHFQTGGYLTEKSANLYEHQVEILFSGAADAMRRLILPQLKAHFPYTEGDGLHFLEVAAGTGRLTRFVKLAFPKAKITVMDLSHPYLKKAQENLGEFRKIDFVQGDSAALPFRDEQFDAVFSCFLFHEIPLEERRKTVAEGLRVLKDGGFYGFVDSIQLEDRKDFEWALRQFPVDFHEPFYKNYIQNSMEGILKNAGLQDVKTDVGFFSKAVGGKKTTFGGQ
ncbi:MAG: class I SAM-dependent methyltransferase [Pseudobdellovibrionaceae bacterium]